MKERLLAGATLGFGLLSGMVGFVSTILSIVLLLCTAYAGWLLFAVQRRRIADLRAEVARLQRAVRHPLGVPTNG